MEYSKGDRVLMVGGMYKCYKAGTCQDKCGSKMASVLIDRDKQRNICLSSIAPMMKKKASDEEEEVVVILRQDYSLLLEEIDALTGAVERLKLKAKSLNNK